MSRPWQIWLIFTACLVVAVVAVGWLSTKALQTDAAQAESAHQAAIEENARLALWRMDSFVAPIIAQENAHPWYLYTSFYSPSQLDNRAKGKNDVAGSIPSPLLTQHSPFVLLHWQIDAENNLTSPEVPLDDFRTRAVPAYLSDKQLIANLTGLDKIRPSIDFRRFGPQLALLVGQTDPVIPNLVAETQSQISQKEYQARAKSFTQNNLVQQRNDLNQTLSESVLSEYSASANVATSLMMPLWSDNGLLLVRAVTIGNHKTLQGCELDWPALKAQMLRDIKDLLPNADLQSIAILFAEDDGPPENHRLASLPVILLPGTLPDSVQHGLSPIKKSLLFAWSALALAALAAAALLRGVVTLSERRAAFVSAVTHELRTPLTTFRMYAEMLREGMVATEEERRQYLDTLRIEADRLTHLVANVLAYARLERGRPSGRIEALFIEQLLTAATGRLADRAAQAQFQLALEPVENVSAVMVKADPAAVEQILFNLVDNACKYAVAASDRTLHLSAAIEKDRVTFRLRDHGPGVSAADQRRLFQAFRKSAQEAAHSAPGVGLGLALSQRLASDMHGELRYEPTAAGGACFALSLPIAEQK
jgi:signal transduction histidine kinase